MWKLYIYEFLVVILQNMHTQLKLKVIGNRGRVVHNKEQNSVILWNAVTSFSENKVIRPPPPYFILWKALKSLGENKVI